jgi:hypothetical protein
MYFSLGDGLQTLAVKLIEVLNEQLIYRIA